MSTLETILKAQGLLELKDTFESQGIDDSMLGSLTDQDLMTIGVGRLGDRKKLLKAFSEIGHSRFEDLVKDTPVISEKLPASSASQMPSHSIGFRIILLFTSAIGSLAFVKLWQFYTQNGAIYLYKDILQWLVFCAALGWLVVNHFLWSRFRKSYQKGSEKFLHILALIFSIYSVVCAFPSLPSRYILSSLLNENSINNNPKNELATNRNNEENEIARAQLAPDDKENEKTFLPDGTVVWLSKRRAPEPSNQRAPEPSNQRAPEYTENQKAAMRQLAGIYELEHTDFLTQKTVTESYEFRSNGECIYSKDSGFGEGGKYLSGQFGNSKINGTWKLNEKGNIVPDGPVYEMRTEGYDLIDDKGKRWLRIR